MMMVFVYITAALLVIIQKTLYDFNVRIMLILNDYAGMCNHTHDCHFLSNPYKISYDFDSCDILNTFAANTVPCKVGLVLLFDLYPMVFSANLFDQKVQQIPSCSIIVRPESQSCNSNKAPSHCITAVELHVAILFRPTAITPS